MPFVCAAAVCIQLINVSSARAPVLADAQRRLAATYAGIGVDVEWAAAPDAILLIVRDDEPGEMRRSSQPVLGAAVHAAQGSRAAYVFYRRAAEEADRYEAPRAAVLACAMAHEIAHLLLPSPAHSRIGLMRASWEYDEFRRAATGELRFSPDEAAAIRARLHPAGTEHRVVHP